MRKELFKRDEEIYKLIKSKTMSYQRIKEIYGFSSKGTVTAIFRRTKKRLENKVTFDIHN